jgi:hypothetical protein
LSGAEDRDEHRQELARIARTAFQKAGLPDSEIDELLEKEGATFAFLDSVSVDSGGTVSSLQPLFGTSREEDVLPRFLGDKTKRRETAEAGRLQDLAQLAARGVGLAPHVQLDQGRPPEQAADEMATSLAQLLLVAELRSNLSGAEPKELSQIPAPTTDKQIERAQTICERLRRDYPQAYEQLADQTERALGLATAGLDPLSIKRINTFRFEERRLLASCAEMLARGEAEHAREIAEQRAELFWTSVARYPERHAAWEACLALARLAAIAHEIRQELASPPRQAAEWLSRYCADDGWHRADRLFRDARSRLARLSDPEELQEAADAVFAAYDEILGPMAEGFVEAYKTSGWEIPRFTSQTEIYQRFVSKRQGPVAYFHVDAMRYEMGKELSELIKQLGASEIQLQPAIAVAPTITDLGMVALLPGAERSFSMTAHETGITGVIDGAPLATASKRMDYAKGAVPGLVEMTLDTLAHDNRRKEIERTVSEASVLLIRSQEIDGAGESLPDNLAQTVMGSVLENVRQGILRLAQAGVKEFVITADHGHLYGARRGEDMKIDAPSGGEKVDLHRRCWVGRGGNTPSACVRLTASELGYNGTDLELVVPKGLGVFRASGSLSYHHGGLSLQELAIPVLTFRLDRTGKAGGRQSGDLVALKQVPTEITNMIFSLTVRRVDLPTEPMSLRLVAESTGKGEQRRIVGGAQFSTAGWDETTQTVTLQDTNPVHVGLQIEDESVTELRVLAIQVDTNRTLADSGPIPVRITR